MGFGSSEVSGLDVDLKGDDELSLNLELSADATGNWPCTWLVGVNMGYVMPGLWGSMS